MALRSPNMKDLAIKVPSRVDEYSKVLGLQSAQLGLRHQQLEVNEAERKQKQGEAIQQALIDSGGDVEAALPKIAQIAPDLLPHFQQFVDQQKTLRITRAGTARTAAEQNLQLQQGTPGEQVGQPGTVTPAGEDPATRQVAGVSVANPQAQPAPIQSGFEQRHVPVEIPGIPDLGIAAMTKRPQTAGEVYAAKQQAARAEAAAKAQEKLGEPFTLGKDQERYVGSQKIASGPAGTDKLSFEESTYQDFLKDLPLVKKYGPSRIGFDKYKQDQKQAEAGPGVDLSGASLDMAARRYLADGTLPPMGMGKAGAGARMKIINRAAVIDPDAAIAANVAEYRANQDSLKKLQSNRDAVVAFENTANKNLDLFVRSAQKVVDSGSPWINQPLRSVQQNGLGSADLIAFNAARQVAINEIAKVTSNPGLSGQLSDSARHEVERFIPENATLAQILSVAKILKADMKNRHESIDEQIQAIKDRVRPTGGGATDKKDFIKPGGALEKLLK